MNNLPGHISAALILAIMLALGAPQTIQAAPPAQEASPTPAPEETAEPTATAENPAPTPIAAPIETPGRETFAASSGIILGIGLTGLLFVLVALWVAYTVRQEKEQQRQQE
jgi:hypothetical protein